MYTNFDDWRNGYLEKMGILIDSVLIWPYTFEAKLLKQS